MDCTYSLYSTCSSIHHSAITNRMICIYIYTYNMTRHIYPCPRNSILKHISDYVKDLYPIINHKIRPYSLLG